MHTTIWKFGIFTVSTNYVISRPFKVEFVRNIHIVMLVKKGAEGRCIYKKKMFTTLASYIFENSVIVALPF